MTSEKSKIHQSSQILQRLPLSSMAHRWLQSTKDPAGEMRPFSSPNKNFGRNDRLENLEICIYIDTVCQNVMSRFWISQSSTGSLCAETTKTMHQPSLQVMKQIQLLHCGFFRISIKPNDPRPFEKNDACLRLQTAALKTTSCHRPHLAAGNEMVDLQYPCHQLPHSLMLKRSQMWPRPPRSSTSEDTGKFWAWYRRSRMAKLRVPEADDAQQDERKHVIASYFACNWPEKQMVDCTRRTINYGI